MVHRLQPGMPVGAMKTYSVRSPIETHTRPATCEEAGCEHWRDGWVTVVDEATDLGMGQAAYIRAEMNDVRKPGQPKVGQRWYYEDRADDGRTVFRFDAGQPCFRAEAHRVSLERPEFYTVRGGDWRADTGLIRQHARPDDWVEDFAGHQDRLHTLHERG
jgi:hypothetical protein